MSTGSNRQLVMSDWRNWCSNLASVGAIVSARGAGIGEVSAEHKTANKSHPREQQAIGKRRERRGVGESADENLQEDTLKGRGQQIGE